MQEVVNRGMRNSKTNSSSNRSRASKPLTSSASCRSDAPHPGVSKLKSQLRQANRLLRKDDLTPTLRETTQQKIAELQAAIENHTTKQKERQNAIRYHRVKFFDRKKVTRRLKKVLGELEQAGLDGQSPEAIRQLETEVKLLRVDLNYVRHYPKHLKYVSLCPSGEYKSHKIPTSPLPETAPSTKDPDSLRSYVRNYIYRLMESGKLSDTPETADQTEAAEDTASDNFKPSLEHDDEFFE